MLDAILQTGCSFALLMLFCWIIVKPDFIMILGGYFLCSCERREGGQEVMGNWVCKRWDEVYGYETLCGVGGLYFLQERWK